jgi:hypothetical protein
LIAVSVRQRQWSAEENRFVSSPVKKLSKRVWAAPNHARLDGHTKAEEVEITYPFIYFRVDDFEHAWKEITLDRTEHIVAVELSAQGPAFTTHNRLKLFSGALSYDGVLLGGEKQSTALASLH